MKGVYGQKNQNTCKRIAIHLDALFAMANNAPQTAHDVTNIVALYIFSGTLPENQKVRDAVTKIDRDATSKALAKFGIRVGGRISGSVFTLYASTGGRFGKFARQQPQKTGYTVSNLVLASTGALILLIIKSRGIGISIIDMWMAILAGQTSSIITDQQYRDVFQAVQSTNARGDMRGQEDFLKLNNEMKFFVDEVRRIIDEDIK